MPMIDWLIRIHGSLPQGDISIGNILFVINEARHRAYIRHDLLAIRGEPTRGVCTRRTLADIIRSGRRDDDSCAFGDDSFRSTGEIGDISLDNNTAAVVHVSLPEPTQSERPLSVGVSTPTRSVRALSELSSTAKLFKSHCESEGSKIEVIMETGM